MSTQCAEPQEEMRSRDSVSALHLRAAMRSPASLLARLAVSKASRPGASTFLLSIPSPIYI